MDGMVRILWFLFETAGTAAFAVSGAFLGLAKKMDLFGVIVLAVLTAVGGGMIRDVLVGVTPPVALQSPRWLLLAIAVAMLTCLIFELLSFSRRSKSLFLVFYNFCDTLGLAAFTVTGVLTGFSRYPQSRFVLPMMLGLLTAVGGGVMRDLMAQRVPVVLDRDVYAVAAVAGGFVLCAARMFVSVPAAAAVAFVCVLALRACVLAFGWQIYHPRPRGILSRYLARRQLRKHKNLRERKS